MSANPHRFDESLRSAALHRYDILDTPPEDEFDDIAAIAAEVCQTPIAVVNFVDTTRQFFKAEVGLGVRETPLDTSFCGHAILTDDLLVIPDATLDPRFECNPLVVQQGGLRFYAGALLKTAEGMPIGTICVLDTRPRALDEHQIRTLRLLARQAMTQLELRRTVADARAAEARHRQVLNSSDSYAIISTDLEGRVTGWNTGAEQIFGWTEAEMSGRPAALVFDPLAQGAVLADRARKTASTAGRHVAKRWYVRKDGSRFFAIDELMPLRSDADRHTGYVHILRDQTAERARTQRLALIAKVAAALVGSDDPSSMLRPVLEAGADTIGFEHFYLFDVMPDGRHLALRHSLGADAPTQAALRHVGFDVPICGVVAAQRERLILSHMQQDDNPRYALARQLGLRSYAGFPLIVGARVVGVISFASAACDSFDAEAIAFFETIARLLSAARERTDAAGVLRAAERRSRLAQEAAGIGTFELDVATGDMMVSEEFCRIFGVPEQQSYHSSVIEALVLGEDAGIRSAPETRQVGSALLDVEYRIRRANGGTVRWLMRQAEFIAGPDGAPMTMVGTVQDITQRKVAEIRQHALLALGEQLRAVTSRDQIATVAAETLFRTLGASRAGCASIDTRNDVLLVEQDCVAPGIESLRGPHKIAGLARTVARIGNGNVSVLNDITAAPDLSGERHHYLSAGIAAQISVPMVSKNQVAALLFVHQDTPRIWTDGEVDFAGRVADRVYAALAKANAEAEQDILNHELSHRLKNSLSMVQAIAAQTLRGSVDKETLDGFLKRMQGLSTAHDVLLHRNWEAAAIGTVVRSTLDAFSRTGRFNISGRAVDLGPRSTLTLSMLLHELATNAVKYGALSNETGRVDVHWSVEAAPDGERELILVWTEAGGPPVTLPTRRGFGSRLINLGLTGTGGVGLSYESSGLIARISAPLHHVQQS